MANTSQTPFDECVSDDLLRAVVRDIATSDQVSVVEKHLDICEACLQKLTALQKELGIHPDVAGNLELLQDIDLKDNFRANIPSFPRVEVRESDVILSEGISLSKPRDKRFIGRLGDYDVTSIVGEGGMGIVLRGWDDRLQRDVALKVMNSRLSRDEVARHRFLTEARAAARLSHPQIVTVHAVAEANQIPFIVMEFVRGKSLALLIAEEGHLDPMVAVELARQILIALDHAHSNSIVHRDIKPGNVLLRESSQQIKLVDFGLARSVADAVRHTGPDSIVGSICYMSPEQASGQSDVDRRSDLFSTGVVLFEMLTGVLPFPGRDEHQILDRIRSEPAPDVRDFSSAIPRPIAEMVTKALVKDIAKRFQSASEFIGAIDGCVASTALTPARGRQQMTVKTGVAKFRRCAGCSEVIVSELSVRGQCTVCQAPICTKCWTVKNIRMCTQHATLDGPSTAPTEEYQIESTRNRAVQQKAISGATDASESSVSKVDDAKSDGESPSDAAHVGESPLPDAAIPEQLWPDSPADPKQNEREVASPVLLDERGSTPDDPTRIAAEDARLAEDTFLRVIENTLRSITKLKDPCFNTEFPVQDWPKVLKRAIRRNQMESDSAGVPTYSGPSGVEVISEVRNPNAWRGAQGRVTISFVSLARTERFARQAFDDEPIAREELESLLNQAAATSSAQEQWQLTILFSPTGWTEEAVDFVSGRGPRFFRDRLLSVVLFDSSTGQFLWDRSDEKLVTLREVFVTDIDEDRLNRAERFVEDHLNVHHSISLETLTAEAGLSQKMAEQAFRIMAAKQQICLETVARAGVVAVRRE